MFKQMQEMFLKIDNLNEEIASLKKEHKQEIKEIKNDYDKAIKHLNEKLTEKDKQIEKLKDENQKMKTEIIRLKNQNQKDSSNSNKPSGTNGFKNVITNRREKSDKKQGGQKRT